MMCALFLQRPGRARRPEHAGRARVRRVLRRLRPHAWPGRCAIAAGAGCLLATIGLNVYLFMRRAEGLFPAAGHRPAHRLAAGRPKHLVSGDERKLQQMVDIVRADPAVETVVGFTGAAAAADAQINTGSVFVSLKPMSQRGVGGRGDRTAAAEARAGAGRTPVPRRRAGSARRRPPEQRAIPVHAASRTT